MHVTYIILQFWKRMGLILSIHFSIVLLLSQQLKIVVMQLFQIMENCLKQVTTVLNWKIKAAWMNTFYCISRPWNTDARIKVFVLLSYSNMYKHEMFIHMWTFIWVMYNLCLEIKMYSYLFLVSVAFLALSLSLFVQVQFPHHSAAMKLRKSVSLFMALQLCTLFHLNVLLPVDGLCVYILKKQFYVTFLIAHSRLFLADRGLISWLHIPYIHATSRHHSCTHC